MSLKTTFVDDSCLILILHEDTDYIDIFLTFGINPWEFMLRDFGINSYTVDSFIFKRLLIFTVEVLFYVRCAVIKKETTLMISLHFFSAFRGNMKTEHLKLDTEKLVSRLLNVVPKHEG